MAPSRRFEAKLRWRLARTARVPGFRLKKAPRKVLELHYGVRLKEDIRERLVEESFAQALREK